MTDNEPTDQGPELLSIARDARFVRIFADDIIVVHRGRDVQISLIAEGPEPIKQAMRGKRLNDFAVQEVQYTHSFTEIARVGLPSPIAFSMAMNIVEEAVVSGNISIELLRNRFLAMLSEHENNRKTREPKTTPAKRKRS